MQEAGSAYAGMPRVDARTDGVSGGCANLARRSNGGAKSRTCAKGRLVRVLPCN